MKEITCTVLSWLRKHETVVCNLCMEAINFVGVDETISLLVELGHNALLYLIVPYKSVDIEAISGLFSFCMNN